MSDGKVVEVEDTTTIDNKDVKYYTGLRNYKHVKIYKGRTQSYKRDKDCSFCNVKYFNTLARKEYIKKITQELKKCSNNISAMSLI